MACRNIVGGVGGAGAGGGDGGDGGDGGRTITSLVRAGDGLRSLGFGERSTTAFGSAAGTRRAGEVGIGRLERCGRLGGVSGTFRATSFALSSRR